MCRHLLLNVFPAEVDLGGPAVFRGAPGRVPDVHQLEGRKRVAGLLPGMPWPGRDRGLLRAASGYHCHHRQVTYYILGTCMLGWSCLPILPLMFLFSFLQAVPTAIMDPVQSWGISIRA